MMNGYFKCAEINGSLHSSNTKVLTVELFANRRENFVQVK